MKWPKESRYALERIDTLDESVWIEKQLTIIPRDVPWGGPFRAVTNESVEISIG